MPEMREYLALEQGKQRAYRGSVSSGGMPEVDAMTERDFWTWLCSMEQEEIFQVAKDALAYGCQQDDLDPVAVALELAASIVDDPRQLPEAHVFDGRG